MALVISERSEPLAPGVIARSDRKKGVVPATDGLPGYVPSSEPDDSVTITPDTQDIDKLRKMLRDYVDLKREEIDERREAWRMYHCKQWTDEELRTLKDRGQPPITFNRVAKKINGVIGLLERLRQDPKAYPRTPAHEQGADLATQCLRYALDASQWEQQLSEVALDLAVPGIGGWEISLEPGEDGSADPHLERQPSDTFFYDPRSLKHDFTDAHFMGVAKWMREAEAKAFLPDAAAQIEESVSSLSNGGDADAMSEDTDNLWWDGELKKLRVVEVWYRDGATWRYAIHTGHVILAEGESPFTDSKGVSACRFIMQSANVDEKGNRYGFVRNLKGAQDEINHRRSKALHAFNTKQVVVEEGIVTDIEALRREAHRVDGVVSLPEGQSGKVRIQSNTDVALANVQMLQDAKEEIENFGPNQALVGQGLDNKSGRAIALLQQAAIAELGPFIVRVRAMKLRCYTLTWETIRQYWTTPRYVRLTDDEGVAGFLGVNQPRTNEFGQVIGTENPIGKVVVDFVLDEGPDTVTLREDAQQAIGQAMQAAGQAMPPQVVVQLSRALISNMNLAPSDKKRIMDAYDQLEQPQQPPPPSPIEQANVELELRNKAATASDKEASAALKIEQARERGMQNRMNAVAAEIAVLGGASMLPTGLSA